jgi:plastocyanin
MRGAWRSILLVGALCAVCGASVAIAFAAPSRAARHKTPTGRRVCHRTKRHHCQATHSKNSPRHKRQSSARAKSLTPSGEGPGAGQLQGAGESGVAKAPTPESSAGSGSAEPGTPEKAFPVKSPTTPAPTHVEVTAEDSEGFRFVLSRSSVPAGKTIIEFVNHGQDEHNLNAVEPTEGSVAGSLPNTASNAHLSLTVDLHPGSYTLFCSLPDHEAKGMKATLVVE